MTWQKVVSTDGEGLALLEPCRPPLDLPDGTGMGGVPGSNPQASYISRQSYHWTSAAHRVKLVIYTASINQHYVPRYNTLLTYPRWRRPHSIGTPSLLRQSITAKEMKVLRPPRLHGA